MNSWEFGSCFFMKIDRLGVWFFIKQQKSINYSHSCICPKFLELDYLSNHDINLLITIRFLNPGIKSGMVHTVWKQSAGPGSHQYPQMDNFTDLVLRKIHVDVEFRRVHRKIMANNDDNRVFQFLLSTKFCFPLYHAQVQLENLHVRKTFGIELGQYVGLYMHLNHNL